MLEASIGIKNSWKYEKDLIQLLNTFRIKKYIIQLGYFWAKFTTNLKSFLWLNANYCQKFVVVCKFFHVILN